MAEKADQAITALPKKTSSGIAATDYLLGIDSAEGYQMLIQDLGNYIIQNVTSSLNGSNQTLAAALSALNSNFIVTSTVDDLCTKVTRIPFTTTVPIYTDVNVTKFLTQDAFSYSAKGFVARVSSTLADAYIAAYPDTCFSVRFDFQNKTITSCTKLPTRAEMNKLVVGTPIDHMRFFGNNDKTFTVLRFSYDSSDSAYIQLLFDTSTKKIQLSKKTADGTETLIGSVTLT